MSIDWSMYPQIALCPYNELLVSYEKDKEVKGAKWGSASKTHAQQKSNTKAVH